MTYLQILRLNLFSAILLRVIFVTAVQVALVSTAFGQKTGKVDYSSEESGDSAIVRALTLDLGKGVSMKLVLIPAGKFMMGNHDTPAETVKKFGGFERNLIDEYPAHEVTISKPFYMGIYEVTQAQWKAMMGTEPWKAERALGYMRLQP
ncbi:MAG: formylglycine-generating enzyme family protein, partial [Akkermansiaceae bacterium]